MNEGGIQEKNQRPYPMPNVLACPYGWRERKVCVCGRGDAVFVRDTFNAPVISSFPGSSRFSTLCGEEPGNEALHNQCNDCHNVSHMHR